MTTKMACEYQELWDSMEKEQCYWFKINNIDGVEVMVFLVHETDYKKNPFLRFQIDNKYDCDEILFNKTAHSAEELKKLMTEVLPVIRFNKYYGKFLVPKKNFDHLLKIPFAKSNADICVVCHELTLTKTDCQHNLCLQCRSQLKKHECPMCRTCLTCGNDCDCNE